MVSRLLLGNGLVADEHKNPHENSKPIFLTYSENKNNVVIQFSDKMEIQRQMLSDVIYPSDQFRHEKDMCSSPLADDLFSLADQLFSETVHTSEGSSCSGYYGGGNSNDNVDNKDNKPSSNKTCCYDDASFDSDNFSPSEIDTSALSVLLEDQPVSNIDYASPTYNNQNFIQEDPLDNLDQLISDAMLGSTNSTTCPPTSSLPPISASCLQRTQFPQPLYANDCMTSILPNLFGMEQQAMPAPAQINSCTYNQPGNGLSSYFPTSLGMMIPGEENYSENMQMSANISLHIPEVIDYQGDNSRLGFYRMGTIQQMNYNPNDIQAIGENHNLTARTGCNSPAPLVTDMSQLDETNFKVGKISKEERIEKINRYKKKKNERNFSKKIKYACRKTLADSRPRVRGRFAKNDETSERKSNGRSHDDDDEIIIKEEENMLDSDIMAQLSSSLGCHYPIEMPWLQGLSSAT